MTQTDLRKIFLLGLALIIFMAVGSVLAESEPNDDFATADPLGVGLGSADTNASLSSTNDVDYYAFTAEAGRTYVMETYDIQSSGGATGLWLYNSSQALIANDQYGNNGTGTGNARIVYTFATGGTYYLRVASESFSGFSGAYSIRVLPKYDEPGAAWDPADDMEPNDVLALANALDVGLSHGQTHQLINHASYATNGPDHDWYRFTAEAGRTYVMETYNVQSSGNATGLWLFDASGAEIINDRYGNNGTGTGNARIVYTFTTGGTYFLLVRQESFSNFTGTYSIRVLPKYDEPGAAWDPANDMEPNDVRVLATPLQVGAVHGEAHRLFDHTPYVTADSDHDWYWFTAVAGIPYVIQTYGVQASGRATGLWLYNDSGTLLEDDQYGSSQTGQASLTYTFVTPGTYFVLVKDARTTTWSGPYSVRVCELDCAQFSYLPVIR